MLQYAALRDYLIILNFVAVIQVFSSKMMQAVVVA